MAFIDLSQLLAPPGVAPLPGQTALPDTAYPRRQKRAQIAATNEMQRILALPRRDIPEPGSARADALVELMNERYRLPPQKLCDCRSAHNRDCITTLLLPQAWALYEAPQTQGMLGIIGVGHGKTGLGLLLPLAMGAQTAVLLLPPKLIKQVIREWQLWGQHWRMPSLISHAPKDPFRDDSKGAPYLHLYPYSLLQQPVGEGLNGIEAIEPDVIIVDEAHKIQNDTATRARLIRYIERRRAQGLRADVCAYSGSMTNKSIKDYAEQITIALKAGSPLPLADHEVKAWATVLDPKKAHITVPPGELIKLCAPGESVREGFRRRLVETPGVISAIESSVADVQLTIEEVFPPDPPDVVQDALQNLRDFGVRPDGEVFVTPLLAAPCAIDLACGFYYHWVFPRQEPDELKERWFTIRKEWQAELRAELQARQEYLDSPHLLAQAAARAHGDLPPKKDAPLWNSQNWPRWREIRNAVYHETRVVRLHPYMAEYVATWATRNRGVVWYNRRAFGAWVAELSRLPLHAGGDKAEEMIMSERGDRSIIASIRAHGTGRDGLQFLFHEQLFSNPAANPNAWEQTLGRLHRRGQKAPIVKAYFARHTNELANAVDQALLRAVYVQQTMGSKQKILSSFLDLNNPEIWHRAFTAAVSVTSSEYAISE